MAEEQVRPTGSAHRRGPLFWVKIAFACAVVLAGGLYLVRSWAEVSRALAEMGWLPMVGSLLPAAGGVIAAMLAWRTLLADLGAPLPVRDGGRVFFASQLGKYLPGSVWPILAQIELARDLKVPRALSLAVSVLAVVLSLSVGLIVALVTLPFGAFGPLPDVLGQGLWWVLPAVPVLLVALHPRVTVGALNVVLRLLRRAPLTVRPSWRGMARAALWQTLSWVLLGLHCYVLVLGYGADPARALPLAIGGFALAYCSGVLFLPAPAGLGVRDLVLAASLAVVLTPPQAFAVVLVSRFALALVDGALAAAWWLRLVSGFRGYSTDRHSRPRT
ncbi:MAG: lysylphosphatidylglycerol synthase domain-containing protein, partial [Pseudonocardiaceae bacterium]